MIDLSKRKGARSIKDIPDNILQQLNAGEIETANLVEGLAINQIQLLENFLAQNDRTFYLKSVLASVNKQRKLSYNTITEAIGSELFLQSNRHNDTALLSLIQSHKADTIRCWGAYFIASDQSLPMTKLFDQIKPFAADTHFGVREIAWLSIRARIIQELEKSIKILSSWASHTDDNIRRFASESTRPRGVWCKHIESLKLQPHLGLPILEQLKSDVSKYVQNSVGNWLNDASKTQPKFVIDVCDRWAIESSTPETIYIIRRSTRSIAK